MIGEAFDGINWGGNRKAANARKDRAADLAVEGYTTYHDQRKALAGNMTYYLFAFDRLEDNEIRPRNPDTHRLGRRLNVRTAHVGMRVAVESTQDYAHPWHAKRGTLKSVTLTDDGIGWAMVAFDNTTPKGEPGPPPQAGIEVHLLRQVAS